MTEQEKRHRRCCFSGQRPQKLKCPEDKVKAWLSTEIDKAIIDGYTTFICGMSMGADLWAGELVLEKKAANPSIRLIAATPYPTFAVKWGDEWRGVYEQVMAAADYKVAVCHGFQADAFSRRNHWIVDHSGKLIACCGDEKSSCRETVAYAIEQGIEVVEHNIDTDKQSERQVESFPFPINLANHAIPGEILPADITPRILIAIGCCLKPQEISLIEARYRNILSLQAIGDANGYTRERARQLINKAELKLNREEIRGFLLNTESENVGDIRKRLDWLLHELKMIQA